MQNEKTFDILIPLKNILLLSCRAWHGISLYYRKYQGIPHQVRYDTKNKTYFSSRM